MIVAPPGEPTVIHGRSSLSTTVGLIEDRGRLPGPGRFGSGTPLVSGTKSKSVSSLLSRNPQPGTVIPEPPVCSIVSVYDATSPHLSAVTRWVVDRPSRGVPCAVVPCAHVV